MRIGALAGLGGALLYNIAFSGFAWSGFTGFTFNSADRNHQGPIRIWFKSKLNVLYNESWWTWSTGLGMD